jgi:hypothetical protein
MAAHVAGCMGSGGIRCGLAGRRLRCGAVVIHQPHGIHRIGCGSVRCDQWWGSAVAGWPHGIRGIPCGVIDVWPCVRRMPYRVLGVANKCSTDCSKGTAGAKELASCEVARWLANTYHDTREGVLGFHPSKEKGDHGSGPQPGSGEVPLSATGLSFTAPRLGYLCQRGNLLARVCACVRAR